MNKAFRYLAFFLMGLLPHVSIAAGYCLDTAGADGLTFSSRSSRVWDMCLRGSVKSVTISNNGSPDAYTYQFNSKGQLFAIDSKDSSVKYEWQGDRMVKESSCYGTSSRPSCNYFVYRYDDKGRLIASNDRQISYRVRSHETLLFPDTSRADFYFVFNQDGLLVSSFNAAEPVINRVTGKDSVKKLDTRYMWTLSEDKKSMQLQVHENGELEGVDGFLVQPSGRLLMDYQLNSYAQLLYQYTYDNNQNWVRREAFKLMRVENK